MTLKSQCCLQKPLLGLGQRRCVKILKKALELLRRRNFRRDPNQSTKESNANEVEQRVHQNKFFQRRLRCTAIKRVSKPTLLESRYRQVAANRYQIILLSLLKKNLTFFPIEKVAKLLEKQSICLVLAPLNFKAFALIRPVPHALGFWRYPICRASFTAQRSSKLVRAAQHSVMARF
jgi:hypothetical protein